MIAFDGQQLLVSLDADGTIAAIVAEKKDGWEIVLQCPFDGAKVDSIREDGTFRFTVIEASGES